jgi:kynurenine formamidase
VATNADKKPEVFVRKASGLIRTAGTLDVLAYNVNFTSIGLLLLFLFLFGPAFYPGASLPWAAVICVICILPLALVYGYLASAMSRSGGDYVYVSRVLGPALGMMSNWNMTCPSSTWAPATTGPRSSRSRTTSTARTSSPTATTVASDGYNLSHVHIGTHIDAPFHFRDQGATVDRMPLELTMGPAVIVPVRGKGPFQQITLADLKPHRARLAPGRIVLFATGWYEHAGTQRFFEHPFLAAEVGQAILDAGVRTIAVDTLNADRTGGEEFPIHDMFADAGGLIAENLAGTAALDMTAEPLLMLLPLNIVGCDGAPVRAAALEPVQG